MSYSHFDLTGKIVLITGAAGFLGEKHAEAVLEAGANVILSDIDQKRCEDLASKLNNKAYVGSATSRPFDVTNKQQIVSQLASYDRIDVLINNADKDPKPHKGSKSMENSFESLQLDTFISGIETSLIGTFLCTQSVINKMPPGSSIINISSDLGIVSPDQRIYPNNTKKPITYSVSKFAIVGMTKYLATYYAESGTFSLSLFLFILVILNSSFYLIIKFFLNKIITEIKNKERVAPENIDTVEKIIL